MRRFVVVTAIALLAAVSSASGAPVSHRVDLVNGTLDGHRVLGLTVPQVEAALGRPDFRTGNGRLQRIGWGTPNDFTLEIIFQRRRRTLRAQTLVFERGTVTDAKAGSLLSQTPARLQSTIESRYGSAFELLHRLTCKHGLCSGEFGAADTSVHLTFGSTTTRGTFITVWKTLA
jgi:hypothetical protein